MSFAASHYKDSINKRCVNEELAQQAQPHLSSKLLVTYLHAWDVDFTVIAAYGCSEHWVINV